MMPDRAACNGASPAREDGANSATKRRGRRSRRLRLDVHGASPPVL